MAEFDRRFEILHPTFDRLNIQNLEVADTDLLNPGSTTPVPLIDGEFVQVDANFKYVRGVTANFAQPSFATVEWRGDQGVQASRKLAAVVGSSYWADTIVWDGSPALGDALEMATLNNARFGSVDRAGLRTATTGLVLGFAMRLPGSNGGRLRFVQTLV